MPRLPTIAALLLLAACGQQQESEAPANEAAASTVAESAKPAVPALNGEWQVTTLRGRQIEPGSALVATFSDGKVRVAAGCNRRAWSFTQTGNIVSFAADPSGSSNCENPPSSVQESAFGAIDRATMALFANEGREASLSGDGGTVGLARR